MGYEQMFIDESATILQAMEKLDQVALKTLFVQQDGRLLAALTDGDIRRWLLQGGSLEASVTNAANYTPRCLTLGSAAKARVLMKRYSLDAVPIIDERKQIVSVVLRHEAPALRGHLSLPVVVMAGGLGKRLYPYTKILPKPLIPIGDIPIVEHIMNQFCRFGCTEFYLVVNHKKNMIKAYFGEIVKPYNVHYADEDIPLGTGGGLSLLKDQITSSFILTNCDILVSEDFEKIYQFHKKKKNIITMICSLKKFSIPYGVVEIGEDGGIAQIKEKPHLSFFTNTGCYIVEPVVIQELEEGVPQGFPDIIEKYRQKGRKVGVYPISEQSWQDMGQIKEMEDMIHQFELRESD